MPTITKQPPTTIVAEETEMPTLAYDVATPVVTPTLGSIESTWLDLQPEDAVVEEAAEFCVYYVRYSTDAQTETSIERQVDYCDSYAEKRKFVPLPGGHVFADRGKSGAFMEERHALAALLEAAVMKKFKVLLVENFDRLSRDLVHAIQIYRKLKALGIEIHATGGGGGKVGDMDAFFQGMVAMLHRERTMELTTKGRWRAAMRGANVSKIPYGYRATETAGGLDIFEEEAKVVRRIFAMYANGMTPGRIVKILNDEGVESPTGRGWGETTILGSARGGKGILRNPRYVGLAVYGRESWTTVAADGRKKRIVRLRPRKHWITKSVPDQRIVDKTLFIRVMSRLKVAARANPEPRERSSRTQTLLFHGRYFCECGSRMNQSFKSGSKVRSLICENARSIRICKRRTSVTTNAVEIEILREIRDRMLDPAALYEFVEHYVRESRRMAAETNGRRAVLATDIEEFNRLIKQSFLAGSFEGASERDIVGARVEWTVARDALERDLRALPPPKRVPEVDTASIHSLREQVDLLIRRMPFKARTPEDFALCAALRKVVGKVVVRRRPGERDYGLTISVSYAGLASDPTIGSEAGLPMQDLARECSAPTSHRHNGPEWLSYLEKLVEDRSCLLDENEWGIVRNALGDAVHRRTRSIIDAALLSCRTGRSPISAPAPYGGRVMLMNIRRYALSGALRKTFEALEAADCRVVAGLDTTRFAHLYPARPEQLDAAA